MKYFYIICLGLSSIFIYKQLNAAEQQQQYAFFVPQNTFLQNTTVDDIDENNMPQKQRRGRKSERIKREITLPYVRKDITLAQPPQKPREEETFYEKSNVEELEPTHISRQVIDEPYKNGDSVWTDDAASSSYSLSDTLSEDEIGNGKKEDKDLKILSPLEEYAKLSVSKMLEKIPFPDVRQPKYKRVYPEYGMDLRVLYRTGEFPYNRDLDNTLDKANTIQRFKVE